MPAESDKTPGPPHQDHDRFQRRLDARREWLEGTDVSLENFIVGMKHQLTQCPNLDPDEVRLLEIKDLLKTALQGLMDIREILVQPQLERLRDVSSFIDVPIKSDVLDEYVNPEEPLPPQLGPSKDPPSPPLPPPEPPSKPRRPRGSGGRQ